MAEPFRLLAEILGIPSAAGRTRRAFNSLLRNFFTWNSMQFRDAIPGTPPTIDTLTPRQFPSIDLHHRAIQKEARMKFFKPLLADDQLSPADPANESSRIEPIGSTGLAAMSYALASHAGATTPAGSLAFDATSLNAVDPGHTAAPAALTATEFKHFIHRAAAPVTQTASVEGVHAVDASTPPVAEQAGTASTNAVEPAAPSSTGTDAAAAAAVSVPEVKTEVAPASAPAPLAELACGPADNHGTLPADSHTVWVIPQPADGADRGENHSMFSVNPPGDDKGAETTAEAVAAATPESTDAPAPADGANALNIDNRIADFMGSGIWCILPVEPEHLRNAPLVVFNIPPLSSVSTEMLEVPQAQAAPALDATTYQAVLATPALSVGAESYAVL